MNKLCGVLGFESDDMFFEHITSSFKEKITKWDYFVDWNKVFNKIKPIEAELNLLNTLIGKNEDFDAVLQSLLNDYPQVIKAFPSLIAIRESSIDVLIDSKSFLYENYSFAFKKNQTLSHDDCIKIIKFVHETGLGKVFQDKSIKNVVDYTIGVEVGLDTNGRKNRGGSLMESLVEEFIVEFCATGNADLQYMEQATASKIKAKWGIDIQVDKSSRRIDFAIKHGEQLYFIECNFYGGGGSKLKSTATEYIGMNRYWNNQGIKFIWITDGLGWKSTLRPLREYFDKADYLLNLEMLKDKALSRIILDEN